MAPHDTSLRRHVFVSYASPDRVVVERLQQSLEAAGIPTWVDDQSISPGTPNWERAIRDGIRNAFAVVLVCSPNTPNSNYVQAELRVAQNHDCIVLPVWVAGDNWVDAIPLSFFTHQHIDARDTNFDGAIQRLTKELQSIVGSRMPRLSTVGTIRECPTGLIPVIVPTRRGACPNPYKFGHYVESDYFDCPLPQGTQILPQGTQIVAAKIVDYPSVEAFIYDLYTNYLQEIYEPFTYGKDWVLAKASSYVTLLALPWQWLEHRRTRRLIEVVPNYRDMSTPSATFGLQLATYRGRRMVWMVIEEGFDNACGVFTSCDDVAADTWSPTTKALALMMSDCDYRSPDESKSGRGVFPLHALNPNDYKHKYVVIPYHRGSHDDKPPQNGVYVIPEDPYRCPNRQL